MLHGLFTDPTSNVAPRFKQYIKEKGFQLKDLTHMGMGLVLTVPTDSSSQLVIVLLVYTVYI